MAVFESGTPLGNNALISELEITVTLVAKTPA